MMPIESGESFLIVFEQNPFAIGEVEIQRHELSKVVAKSGEVQVTPEMNQIELMRDSAGRRVVP